jgi:Cytochrome bd terminal oxidase subunit II
MPRAHFVDVAAQPDSADREPGIAVCFGDPGFLQEFQPAAADRPLRTYFTRRAQVAAVTAGALSLAALSEVRNSDPAFFDRLTGRALPLVVLAGVCGLAVLALITAGRPRGSRIIAALGVAAVIWGWGVAQFPVLLPRTAVTLTNAGATQATFDALVVVAIAAVILVVPSFALLYSLQGRRMLGGEEQGTPPAAAASRSTARPSAGPPTLATAIAACAAAGVASVIFLTTGNATIQLASDPEYRGRVTALWSLALVGSTPIGSPVIGALSALAGPRYALGLGAVACLAAVIVGGCHSHRYQEEP